MEPGLARHVRVFKDLPSASRALARHVAHRAAESVHARGGFSLVLSGGSTPRALFRNLAGRYRDRVPWEDLEVFFADERCVSPRSSESNYGMAREELLSHVPLRRGNVHRLRGEVRPATTEVRRYSELIAGGPPAHPTISPDPRFDLVLLGIGVDGHTASLFPGARELDERRRNVVYVAQPGQAPFVPRLTLTFRALASAREVCFLVSGQDKVAAVSGIFRSAPGGTPRFPASLLAPRGSTVWYLDREASAGLPADAAFLRSP